MSKISKHEKRFIRRELINKALHAPTIGNGIKTLCYIIATVREWERLTYRMQGYTK